VYRYVYSEMVMLSDCFVQADELEESILWQVQKTTPALGVPARRSSYDLLKRCQAATSQHNASGRDSCRKQQPFDWL